MLTTLAAAAWPLCRLPPSPLLTFGIPPSPSLQTTAAGSLLEALQLPQQQLSGGSAAGLAGLLAAARRLGGGASMHTSPAAAAAAAEEAAEQEVDLDSWLPAIPIEQQAEQGLYRDLTVPVLNLRAEPVGSYTLPGDLFDVPIRRDILQRVVRWQLAKRQQVRGLGGGRQGGGVGWVVWAGGRRAPLQRRQAQSPAVGQPCSARSAATRHNLRAHPRCRERTRPWGAARCAAAGASRGRRRAAGSRGRARFARRSGECGRVTWLGAGHCRRDW